jgi:uncharacterized protein
MSGDWRTGQPAIHYLRCPSCNDAWYVGRPRCARCGAPGLVATASGAGVVAAATRVERAPSPEWRTLLPYTLVLVDAAEGFRMMAHADDGVAVGDAVAARFRRVGDALLPCFGRRGP